MKNFNFIFGRNCPQNQLAIKLFEEYISPFNKVCLFEEVIYLNLEKEPSNEDTVLVIGNSVHEDSIFHLYSKGCKVFIFLEKGEEEYNLQYMEDKNGRVRPEHIKSDVDFLTWMASNINFGKEKVLVNTIVESISSFYSSVPNRRQLALVKWLDSKGLILKAFDMFQYLDELNQAVEQGERMLKLVEKEIESKRYKTFECKGFGTLKIFNVKEDIRVIGHLLSQQEECGAVVMYEGRNVYVVNSSKKEGYSAREIMYETIGCRRGFVNFASVRLWLDCNPDDFGKLY